jgi:hypothetical protein
VIQFSDVALSAVRVLLCDADGNLFPSEEPAFAAPVDVLRPDPEVRDVLGELADLLLPAVRPPP